MGLEAASFISQLVSTNPVGGTDDYATADDHLRLIKAVLQGQFPNFTAVALNATQAELDTLDGYTGTLADHNLLSGAAAAGLTAVELLILNGFTGTTGDLNILSGADAVGLTAAEFLFLNGVTSGIQGQIDGKAPTAHSHTAGEISDLDTSDITTGTFANARIAVGNVTQHEAALTLVVGQIPNLDTAKITTGIFANRDFACCWR